MLQRWMVLSLALSAGLAGCSKSGEEATESTTPAQPTADHVWSDQTRALEKAKEVERMLQEAAERQRQAIEEQSR